MDTGARERATHFGPPVGRELHRFVRAQVIRRLGSRTWKWLAHRSGIPPSTLSSQVSRPKFSLEVVVRIAHALGEDPASLLPPHPAQSSDGPLESRRDDGPRRSNGG